MRVQSATQRSASNHIVQSQRELHTRYTKLHLHSSKKEEINSTCLPCSHIWESTKSGAREPSGQDQILLLQVLDKNDPAYHPPYSQFGVFASRSIMKGDLRLEYVCEYKLVSEFQAEVNRNDDREEYKHLYTCDSLSVPGITGDASDHHGLASYINDFRDDIGRPCGPQQREPNVAFFDALVNGSLHIFVTNLRDLEKGEQLLVDYGSGFWGREGFDGVLKRCRDATDRVTRQIKVKCEIS